MLLRLLGLSLHLIQIGHCQFRLLSSSVDPLALVPSMLRCTRRCQIQLLLSRVNLIVSDDSANDFPDVFLKGHALQEIGYALELSVGRVVIPRHGWNGILWLEKVSYWRIVNNDDVFHGPSKPCQILHIGVIEECAVLSEQQVRAHLARIEVLHQWLRILGQARSEDHQLVDLVHLFEELCDEGTHKHVDGAYLIVDLDWEHDVGIFNRFEG